MRRAIPTAVVGVLCAVASYLALDAAIEGPPARAADTSSAVATTNPNLLDLTPGRALSSSALAELDRSNSTFSEAPSSTASKIDERAAIARAGVDLGFLNSGEEVNASLGWYSDDPSRPDTTAHAVDDFDPKLEKRLVWLVEVRGFSMPMFGPSGPLTTDQSSDPDSAEKVAPSTAPKPGGSDGLFVIDAQSGELIKGSQYSHYPEDMAGD